MDSTQFVWWLKGFLHDKKHLSQEDIELIKTESDKVVDWPGYYTQGYWKMITKPVIPVAPYLPNSPDSPYYIGDPITNPGWTCETTWTI